MAKNPCAKRVEPQNAYECWQTPDGLTTYHVCKKHQSPEKEAQNSYAMWYVWAKGVHTSERGEYGDMYAVNVMAGNIKVDNPLCVYVCIAPATADSLTDLGLGDYRTTHLVNLDPRLINYVRLQVPTGKMTEVAMKLRKSDVRIVADGDIEHYIDACVTDVLSN